MTHDDDDNDFEDIEPSLEDLSQIEVEDMAEDLAEITMDFIDNHEISLSEFNGLMLAQIVKTYMDQGLIDELKSLVDHVQKHIDGVASTKVH
jgi:hypothetical protein